MKPWRLLQTRWLVLGVMTVAWWPCAAQSAARPDLDSDRWQWSITPYFWFSGIDGDVRVRDTKVEVDVGFDEIWDALDFGAQVHVEA